MNKTEISANIAAFGSAAFMAKRAIVLGQAVSVSSIGVTTATAVALSPMITSIAAGCAAYWLVKKTLEKL